MRPALTRPLARLALAAVVAVAPALSACASAQAPGAAQVVSGKSAVAAHSMVTTANPLATAAGLEVLQQGGGAVDAAAAIQAVLGLVEPQSSGLGGGAFMVYYDAQTGEVTAYDGRETAPAGADARMFLGTDGRPMSFRDAVVSGRATGVPGAVAMLAKAHADHGKLAWSGLFGAATRLATDGFVVSPRLARFASGNFPQASTPDAIAYFTKPDGARYAEGDLLKNPAYAATLRRVAADGAAALLTGPTAQAIVDKTRQAPLPGTMTTADLAAYAPKVQPAVCTPYLQWRLCAAPPPSGGAGVLEIMGLLARTDIAERGPDDAKGWLQFAEASRLGYADRDYFFGDPAFTPVPLAGLLDPAYLSARAEAIGETAAAEVTHGRPSGAQAHAADRTLEPGGTSSFAVVDADGDVLAMTTTVESIFGTGRMVDGFFLNNQLTDFSFSPTAPDGTPAANAVAGGKRPRSSMSPMIVLDRDGRFVAAIGSPGGNSIIAYVAKTLVGLLAWDLSMTDAIALPNMIARGANVGVESNFDPAIGARLTALGLRLSTGQGEESGLHGVARTPQGYEGAADPRREGVAAGF